MAITKRNELNSLSLYRNEVSINIYQMIEDAYKGVGGYIDKTYLVKHKRETDADFTIRKEISPYKNYFKRIVDNYVGALYVTDPERQTENADPLLESFMMDADGRGNRFSDVIRWVNADAALYGCVMVVVDNFSDISQSEADNLKRRALPYMYWIRPDSIKAIYTNDVGKMIGVCYAFAAETEDGQTETRYRVWTETETFVTKEDPAQMPTSTDSEIEIIGDVVVHGLGALPLFFAYSYSQGTDIIVPPKFLSQMEVNDSVFQQTSEIAEYRRKFVFPVLTIQGEIVTDVDSDGNKIVRVGNDKALQYSSEVSNSPEFLTPDFQGLKEMMNGLASDIAELETSAGTSNTLSSSASGDTRRVFWAITNVDKADFAQQAERTEEQIIKMFGLWSKGSADYYEYFVQYSRKFGLDDEQFKLDLLEQRQRITAEYPKLKARVVIEQLRSLLPDVSDDELDLYAQMIEEEEQQNTIDVTQTDG